MRILLLTHYYHPEHGAPQRRWNAVVRELREQGHDVVVIAPPPHYPGGRLLASDRAAHGAGRLERGRSGEVVIRSHYAPHRGSLLSRTVDHAVAAADSLRRAMLRFGRPGARPDIVVATAPAVETLVTGNLLARWWGRPLLVEMRDAWPDLVSFVEVAATGDGSRLVGTAKALAHAAVTDLQRRADAVVTTTAAFAAILEKRGLEPVHVVRNGTDTTRVLHLGPADASAHPGLRCVYMGNLGRSQGLEVVVHAAAELARRGVPIEVRLIGHGAHAAALARLARALDAPVVVGARVTHDEVAREYAWADTLIVSLRDWEPFAWTVPSKLYEVLATGRHVTGVLRGESASIVDASGAGDVTPPGDVEALVALWAGLADDRSRLVPRGDSRAWVMSHAESSVLAARYVHLMEDMVRP